jgi:hypothetical protein
MTDDALPAPQNYDGGSPEQCHGTSINMTRTGNSVARSSRSPTSTSSRRTNRKPPRLLAKHMRDCLVAETADFVRRWYAPYLTMRELREEVQPFVYFEELLKRLESPYQRTLELLQKADPFRQLFEPRRTPAEENAAKQKLLDQVEWKAYLHANRRDGNVVDIDAAVDRCRSFSRIKRSRSLDADRNTNRALLVEATEAAVRVRRGNNGHRKYGQCSFGDLPGDASPEIMRETLGRAFGKVTRQAGRRLRECLVGDLRSRPDREDDVAEGIAAAEIARLVRDCCRAMGPAGEAALDYRVDQYWSRRELARKWRVTEKQIRDAEPKVQQVIARFDPRARRESSGI